jgi:type I restriction enzyme S subunit
MINSIDIQEYVSGSAQPKLNQKNLNRILIPTPPLDLQQRFARIVESIEQQKARMRCHLDELDTLFASLQSRAFNGELGIGIEGQQELEGMLGCTGMGK